MKNMLLFSYKNNFKWFFYVYIIFSLRDSGDQFYRNCSMMHMFYNFTKTKKMKWEMMMYDSSSIFWFRYFKKTY